MLNREQLDEETRYLFDRDLDKPHTDEEEYGFEKRAKTQIVENGWFRVFESWNDYLRKYCKTPESVINFAKLFWNYDGCEYPVPRPHKFLGYFYYRIDFDLEKYDDFGILDSIAITILPLGGFLEASMLFNPYYSPESDPKIIAEVEAYRRGEGVQSSSQSGVATAEVDSSREPIEKKRRSKRKAIIDDGCNPELVAGARFQGVFEIPMIQNLYCKFVPKQIVPFSERENVENPKEVAIGFYEYDVKFARVLERPQDYIEDFARFGAIISPDCSLYRDSPLAVQITNVYRNRAIGSYYQRRGLNVIPQIRWGDERTYTKSELPERIAFRGVEKGSVVAIGSYGCMKDRDNKYYFRRGLVAMLKVLKPETVFVYGPMPDKIFGDLLDQTKFVQFDDWRTSKRKGSGE
ncbi:MAG: DUF4417 domain-containing protein [Thermoguttaceae bacterium]|nr:DUF4417 domain-containing protein [Thermoguttaceae bacterium]